MSSQRPQVAVALWREGLRSPRTLVIRGLLPFLLLGVVGVVTLLPQQASQDDRRETFRVGVQGDLAALRAALDPLIAAKLELVPTDDPALDAALELDAAVRLPDDVGAAVTDPGADRAVVVYQRNRSRSSRAAAQLTELGIAALNREAQARGAVAAGIDPAGAVRYALLDVQRTREGASAIYAQVGAGLVALQASVVVGSAAVRTGGRRPSATLTALLLLPMRRRRLVRELALADTALGVLANAPVLLVVAAGAALFAQFEHDTAAAVAAAASVVVTGLALTLLMAATGTWVGLRARSHDQASLVSSGVTVAVAAVAGVVGLGEQPLPAIADVLPLAGAVNALRAALDDPGLVGLVRVGVAAAITVVATTVPLRRAARAADLDRAGMRLA